jgi:hypothetical protein
MGYTSHLPITAILLKLGRLAVEHTDWLATEVDTYARQHRGYAVTRLLVRSRHNRQKRAVRFFRCDSKNGMLDHICKCDMHEHEKIDGEVDWRRFERRLSHNLHCKDRVATEHM